MVPVKRTRASIGASATSARCANGSATVSAMRSPSDTAMGVESSVLSAAVLFALGRAGDSEAVLNTDGQRRIRANSTDS